MDSSPFSSQFLEQFPDKVRVRGQECVESARVQEVEFEEDRVRARVDGDVAYWVEVLFDSTNGLGKCTCPAFDRYGPCMHMWAVAVIANGDQKDADDDWAIDEAPTVSLAWQERLTSIQSNDDPRVESPLDQLERRRLRVEYVLDIDASETRGRPVIQTMKRRAKKDGTWGKAQEYRPGFGSTDPVPDGEDLELLIELGAIKDDEALFAQAGASAKFPLSKRKAPHMLRRLCATGRASWCKGEAEGPLQWDDGETWKFEMFLGREERDGVQILVLNGRILRDDVEFPLEAPTAMIDPGLILINNVLARFDAADASNWAREMHARGPIVVPALQEDALMAQLASTPSSAWSDGTEYKTQSNIQPRPQLKIYGSSTWRHGRVECDVTFDYGNGRVVGAHDTRLVLKDVEGVMPVRRELEFERAALQQFDAVSGQSNESDRMGRGNSSIEERARERAISELLGAGWQVQVEGQNLLAAGEFQVSVRSGIDWFDLEGGMEFGSLFASIPELLAAAREGRQSVRLEDGSLGVLPEGWLDKWGLLDFAGQVEGDAVRFAANQGWLLDTLLATRESVAVDEGFERYREKLKSFERIEPKDEPEGFHGELRPYQREGLGWFAFLRELGLGGCLADDMGLGKTVQVLALLQSRRQEVIASGAEMRPSLVVAPRSLVFNWVAEAERFAPDIVVLDHTGPDRAKRWKAAKNAELIITTYGTLRRDAPGLAKHEFDYVILDEATAIKNSASQAAKASRLLNARNRLALSGTPIENHVGELWSLFEFLNPGMLGRSTVFSRFAAQRGGQIEFEQLAAALRPFFLRRKKSEVLDDLPEKTEQIVMCELGTEERRRYNEVRDHFRAQLLGKAEDDGLGRIKMQVLEALLRLRQCACHPSLMDADRIDEESAKLNYLLPRLEELVEKGHKVLVFSQFTRFLAVVRDRLDKNGTVYEYLDGRTRKRKEKVERFQSDPDCPVFLISLKAGGHGLNLTCADYVFLLDPWWNPAIESQAIDRAHRIGQTKPVFAYRLIAEGTVEEKVLELQDSKREMVEALLSQGGSVLRDLTRSDLEVLLS